MSAKQTLEQDVGGGDFISLTIASTRRWAITPTTELAGFDSVRFRSDLNSSGLGLYLTADVTDNCDMMWLWPAAQAMPTLPSTGKYPSFAVYGDLLAGDYWCIGSNPMTLFGRVETGLSPSAVTQLFSAKNNVNDTDGGAAIIMAPGQNGGGTGNDGYIGLVAYGQETGALANSVLIGNRTAANTMTWQWAVGKNVAPQTDATQNIGSAGGRIGTIYTENLYTPGIGTTANAASAYIDSSSGQVLRSTSMRRFKREIADLVPDGLLEKLRPVSFKSKASADDPRRTFFGFVAEEVCSAHDALATLSKGEATNVDDRAVLAVVVAELQKAKQKITELENRNSHSFFKRLFSFA